METIQITKDKTAIIKGIAILFMIAHHCLIREFYINPSPFLSTLPCWKLCSFNKICVALFTFFVGYGFYYSYKTFGTYFTRHVGTLLKYYWFYLFVLAIPLTARVGEYPLRINDIALNMVGLKHGFCLGNWYVYFYIYCLLILPLFRYVFHNRIYIKTIVVVLLCGVLSYVTSSNNIYLRAISESMFYTPVLVMGYVCAYTQILSMLGRKVNSKISWLILLVCLCLGRIICGGGGHWGISTDTVIAPIFIISTCALFAGQENHWIAKALTSLGENSTLMWFVHCLFFSTATKSFFQSLEVWPSNIIFVFVMVTAVSFIVSIVLNTIFKKIRFIS